MIKINENITSTSAVSVRDMKTEVWKALRKLAMIDEKSLPDYVEKLVREELERLGNE